MLPEAEGRDPDEIAGAAEAMRAACVPVKTQGTLLDIVGTGGDGACTINLSTCSAILAAACGAKVTKCGNPLGIIGLRRRRCARSSGTRLRTRPRRRHEMY